MEINVKIDLSEQAVKLLEDLIRSLNKAEPKEPKKPRDEPKEPKVEPKEPAPKTSVPSKHTPEELRILVNKFVAKQRSKEVRSLMETRYGVTRVPDVPSNKLDEFYDALEKIL